MVPIIYRDFINIYQFAPVRLAPAVQRADNSSQGIDRYPAGNLYYNQYILYGG